LDEGERRGTPSKEITLGCRKYALLNTMPTLPSIDLVTIEIEEDSAGLLLIRKP
jgi:hypothetical protein